MNEAVSYKEFVESVSGADSQGRPKSFFSMIRETIISGGERFTEDELFIEKPVIQIFQQLNYMTLEFAYKSSGDEDLRLQWDFLNEYFSSSNSLNDEEGKIPSLIITVVPKEFDGKYSILAADPILYYLSPRSPMEPEPSVIRLVFPEENVKYYYNPDFDINEVLDEMEEEMNDE